MLLTIRETARRSGLTEHTLRYYERIGLLGDIARGSDGHRRYSEANLDRLKVLTCLRGCGMSIQGLQAFVALYADGDEDGSRRRTMLEQQRQIALASIEQVRAHIAMIDTKLEYLERLQPDQPSLISSTTEAAD